MLVLLVCGSSPRVELSVYRCVVYVDRNGSQHLYIHHGNGTSERAFPKKAKLARDEHTEVRTMNMER